MFKRTHHQRIAKVLATLDGERLRKLGCWFGGGTAIALLNHEFRESVDIDFLISNVDGYRELRHAMTGVAGFAAITKHRAQIQAVREIRADQYGIRTMVQVDETPIKFEIVLEGRMSLDANSERPQIEGIACLTHVDQVASKLLANSDRWADDAVFSRDLIDLVMMCPSKDVFDAGLAKAEKAYGHSVMRDLKKALTQLHTREGRLMRWKALQFTKEPKPHPVIPPSVIDATKRGVEAMQDARRRGTGQGQ